MYINPYLEAKLADKRIQEALCVAKLECLFGGDQYFSGRNRRRSFIGFLSLPLLILMAPFHLGSNILRRI